MADEEIPPWSQRNQILKVYKITGDFGWLHLVVAQEKTTGRKFLRLKRYKNWFAIPNSDYLSLVNAMLHKGAQYLNWNCNGDSNICIQELSEDGEIKQVFEADCEIPEELICLIENNPKIVEDILQIYSNKGSLRDLSGLYGILNNSVVLSSERLRVAFKEVIEKISQEDEKGLQSLADLMNQWNLYQITSITSLVKSRLETIRTFEQMIHDMNTYEINTDKSIHRVLEKSMWLIDENLFLSHSNRSLQTFIGKELEERHKKLKNKRFDFAVVDADNKLLILEIKAPNIVLQKGEIDQIEEYLRIVKQYKAKTYRSVEGFLIGNKISREAYEIMEYRKGIKLMTYDDLLERCRKRYDQYLKIAEK